MTDEPKNDDAPGDVDSEAIYPDDTLPAALARHQVVMAPAQIALLDRYCRLLWDINTQLNLTRHTTYEKFVARDLVDSLQLAALLQPEERVLDVGTGGGVPGVVLAIVRPDLRVTLSDSVGKKARAVESIVNQLNLKLPVFNRPAQDLIVEQEFDTLAIRAVARLTKILRWFGPHAERFGRLLLIKGPSWIEERGEARHLGLMSRFDLRRLASYPLPGTNSESVILEIRRKAGA